MQHIVKTYKDGFKDIEYCVVCGKEGVELKINPKCEKAIDKEKPRN